MSNWSNFDLEKIFKMKVSEVDEVIKNQDKYVIEFQVPKNDGKMRNITNPIGSLRYLLEGINYRILTAYKTHSASHGFTAKRSVITSAEQHLGANATGSIDIKKFFDNTNRAHLDNVLHGNKKLCKLCRHYDQMQNKRCSPSLYENKHNNFEHKCEEVLTNIIPDYEDRSGYQSLFRRVKDLVIFKNHTPQGFPTSPNLANIVLVGLDKMVEKSIAGKDIVYTRYADDLAFSTKENDKVWLKNNTLGMATSIIKAFDYQVNKNKTKYCGRGTRLQICSVVINDHMSLAKYKIKNFRARIHNAFVKNEVKPTESEVRSMLGYAAWITAVNPRVGRIYTKKIKDHLIDQ